MEGNVGNKLLGMSWWSFKWWYGCGEKVIDVGNIIRKKLIEFGDGLNVGWVEEI